MTLPEPARFALLTNGLASGSDAQAQLLARALVFAGQEAALLTIRPSRAPDLEALGVPVAVVGQRGCAPGPRTTVETVRVLRRRPPDGVVSFGYHAHLLGRSAGRITGVPTIVSVIRNESVVGCTRE